MIIIYAIVWAIILSVVAASKGQSKAKWALIGLFGSFGVYIGAAMLASLVFGTSADNLVVSISFGSSILAMVIVAILIPQKPKQVAENETGSDAAAEEKS